MRFQCKRIGLLCLITVLSSCGIFSNKKELPQGERISVLEMPDQTLSVNNVQKKSISISSPLTNINWAQSGDNATHLVQNILANADIKEAWSVDFGDGSSKRNLLLASPIIYNGKVFAQDVNATVYAFELKTGKEIFKTKLKPQNENDASSALNGVGLAADNNKIYALTGFGSAFALNAQTGEIIWRKDFNVPLRVAPVVANNKIFVQTIDNQLLCLDASNGSEIWNYGISAEDTVLAGGAVPAYDAQKEILVAGFSNGEVQAFNGRIGYPIWSNNLINNQQIGSSLGINAIKAAPVIDGNVVYVVGSTDLTLAINLENGDVLWEAPIGGTNTPWVDSEAIFILSNNFELYALDKQTGSILFKKEFLRDISARKRRNLYANGPVMINSQLFVTTSSGLIYAFSAQNGAEKNKIESKENIAFAPIAAQKTVVITTEDAELIAFE